MLRCHAANKSFGATKRRSYACEQNRRLKWKPIVMLLNFEPSFVQESALVALSTFAFLPKLAWQTRWTVILELEVRN